MSAQFKSDRHLRAERAIQQNEWDVPAWRGLFEEAQKLSVAQARESYDRFLKRFPMAAAYWKLYIEHELDNKNYAQVEELFGLSLLQCNDVSLYETYLAYMKERKTPEELDVMYKWVLDQVGDSFLSTSIHKDYVASLKITDAASSVDDGLKVMDIRRSYQRAVKKPRVKIRDLWEEYAEYEKSHHAAIAKKVLDDCARSYNVARRISRELENKLKVIDRAMLAYPPSSDARQEQQLQLWEKYIEFEKGNPMGYEGNDEAQVVKRTHSAYKECLKNFTHHEKVWIDAATYLLTEGDKAKKAGHSNQAEELLDASDEIYSKGRKALPNSLMIAFASADQLEARSKVEEAKAIYEELLKDGGADITLVYINYMKCCRRTNGIKAVREVFSKRVTKDDRCGHQAIVASAQIELEFAGTKASDEKSKKKKEVCVNVFEWGLKKFKDRPQFIQAYLAHLSQKSAEQANTRSVFERIIDSLPADGAEDIWREFHHFETLYGDLKSLERVEQRREEKYPEEFTGKPAKQMVDRYRFMDLLPASSGALRTFGIVEKVQTGAAVASPTAAVAPAPVQEQLLLPPPREEQRYYMPDIRQLGPFRPTRNPLIPDFGIFMPASAKAMLKLLPPPKFYVAETRLLDVEKLMKEILARDIPEVAGATLDEPIATSSIPARGKRKITEVAPAADIFQARQRQKAAAKAN